MAAGRNGDRQHRDSERRRVKFKRVRLNSQSTEIPPAILRIQRALRPAARGNFSALEVVLDANGGEHDLFA